LRVFRSPGDRLYEFISSIMLVHTVVFWLRKDLSPAEIGAFRAEGLESLRPIAGVRQLFIGTPAPIPPRPVVDASYTYAITLLFDGVAAHDAYQIDPVHQAFVARFKSCWERVQIYDAS
jgi:hypothetical protein